MKNKQELTRHLQDELDLDAYQQNILAEQDERPERVVPKSAAEVIGHDLDLLKDELVSVKIKIMIELEFKTAQIVAGWAANSGLSIGEYCEYLVKRDVVDGLK